MNIYSKNVLWSYMATTRWRWWIAYYTTTLWLTTHLKLRIGTKRISVCVTDSAETEMAQQQLTLIKITSAYG